MGCAFVRTDHATLYSIRTVWLAHGIIECDVDGFIFIWVC